MSETQLPEYLRPPINEVALSVQVEPLPELTIAQMGLFWSCVREHYPNVQHNNPLDSTIERTGLRKDPMGAQLRFTAQAPNPRLWFISEDGRELLQLQQDMFIRNWRKQAATDEYPRYNDHLRTAFIHDYQIYLEFLKSEGFNSVTPNQCSVTYVNHIKSPEWSTHADASQVFQFLDNSSAPIRGVTLEDVSGTLKYMMLDEEGSFAGRLHVELVPGFDQTKNEPIYVFRLTARGHPAGEGVDGVIGFLDYGREKIVKFFEEFTTEEMSLLWKRK